VKLCGNFLSFTAMQAMREALRVAKATGIDSGVMMDMLVHTLIPARIYQSYGPQIARDPEQALSSWIAEKDVRLFDEAALQAEILAPIADVLYGLFKFG
jgi:3-hydroxyisobutyrate dehydrogenase-like beta-hydroxyacid dehydrogenase